MWYEILLNYILHHNVFNRLNTKRDPLWYHKETVQKGSSRLSSPGKSRIWPLKTNLQASPTDPVPRHLMNTETQNHRSLSDEPSLPPPPPTPPHPGIFRCSDCAESEEWFFREDGHSVHRTYLVGNQKPQLDNCTSVSSISPWETPHHLFTVSVTKKKKKKADIFPGLENWTLGLACNALTSHD